MSDINKKQMVAIITIVTVLSTIFNGLAINQGWITPQQGQINEQLLKGIIDQKIADWWNQGLGGSPYLTEKPCSFIVNTVTVGGTVYYYALNGTTGKLAYYSSTDANTVIAQLIGNNRHIYVKAGSYPINTRVTFSNVQNMIFECENGAIFTTTIIATGSGPFRVFGNVKNFLWMGGTIQGSAAQYDNDVYAITLSGYGTGNVDVVFDGVTIKQFSRGIRVEDSSSSLIQNGLIIKNCHLENMRYQAIAVMWATNVVLSRNFVKNVAGCGIYVSGVNIIISENVIVDCPMVSDYNAAITVYNPRETYYENVTKNVIVSDNVIRWVNTPTATDWVIGILVSGEGNGLTTTEGVTVSGNTVTGLMPASNKVNVGIYLHTWPTVNIDNVRDVTIVGNAIKNVLIAIALSGKYVVAQGNVAEGVGKGIYVGTGNTPPYHIITQNILKGIDKTNPDYFGIMLSYHVNATLVCQNQIETFYDGITDYIHGSPYVGKNVIEQNSIRDCTNPIHIHEVDATIKFNFINDLPTENSGTATISASTSMTFNHGLAGTPTGVWASFSSTAVDGWTWTATSTQITITVTPSGSYTVYWNAEYKP